MAAAKLRVMQLLAPLTLAGAERVVLNQLRYLDPARFEQHVFLQLNARRPDDLVAAEVRKLGIEPETYHLERLIDWQQVREVASALKRHKIDILHTHGYRTDVIGYLATRSSRVPRVSTVHGWIANTRRAHVYHFLQKLALRHFDHVIAVSDAIEAELLRWGVSRARLSKVTNAVEMPVSPGLGNGALRRELGIGPGAKLVGTVGRLSKEKGLPYFLEAAAQIQAECPEAVFVVVGEGKERADLEAQAVRLGLNGRVHFYGYCREMEMVYPSLDLFVLPSLTEGLPMTLLEAISFEVPFVASAVGEIPVLLGTHAPGQLIPPGDAAALAQAMRSALRNPEAAKGVARGARRHLLDNWNVERWRGRIEGIYRQVVAGR